jgi:transmembrane E3 ubiquitin-protein ligase
MDSRGTFLFVLIVLSLFLNSQVRPPLIDHDKEHQRQVAEEQHALQLLNESRYGDFDAAADRWLLIPGLRRNDSYFWDLLSSAQDRARRDLRAALASAGISVPGPLVVQDENVSLNLTDINLPVYRNVTGKLRGDWVRQRLQDSTPSIRPSLNITRPRRENEYTTRDFGLNITGDFGILYLELREGNGEELLQGRSRVREIRADLAVESGSSFGNTWYMSLYGVHFPELGQIILATTSEKFGGIFALPHFALSEDTFHVSHDLLVKSLSDAILEKQNHAPTFFPWSSLPHGSPSVAFPTPTCEYIVYLQQHPITLDGYLAHSVLLEQIEDELRFPMGAPIPPPPLMMMSAVVVSPDCGMILQTKETLDYPPTQPLYLVGPKQELYSIYASRLVFGVAGVSVAQISLLLRQIKDASTPSTRSRISFYTIAMMAMGDALVLTFILLELFSEISFLVLAASAFLGFLSVSYIGMRFMMEIWAVQAPERRDQVRSPAPQSEDAQQVLLPPPVPATDSGATPVILPPDQDEPEGEPQPNRGATQGRRQAGSDVGSMYARFYFALCCLLFFSLWSLLWPSWLGAIYARFLGFFYISFWTPQIYRNIMRNCRKSLRWDFVIGESILRLFPFVYFFTIRGNVLFIHPDPNTALTMAGWVWVQVWALASQNILGPRFFVPRGWAPPAYDYHPILRDTSASVFGEDVESGGMLPIGLLRVEERGSPSSGKDGDKHRQKDRKRVFDCAICMQDIEVPITPGGTSGSSVAESATSIFGRRTYMVTPCQHIFHSTCLESWMNLRLQCPICREPIPPV